MPGDGDHADEPDAEEHDRQDPMTAITTPKTTPRAATMAGRMARSLTVATTVSTVSRARADSASVMSFSATGGDYPALPAALAGTM